MTMPRETKNEITGAEVFAAATAWTKTTDVQREKFEERARRRVARGEETSAQAEYMAAKLRSRKRQTSAR
jgi:hypothetical protein